MPKPSIEKIRSELRKPNINEKRISESLKRLTTDEIKELNGKVGAEFLFTAQKKNNNKIILMLLSAGANSNYINRSDQLEFFTPFTKALALLDVEQVKSMLEHGADVEMKLNGSNIIYFFINHYFFDQDSNDAEITKKVETILRLILESAKKQGKHISLLNTSHVGANQRHEGHTFLQETLIFKRNNIIKILLEFGSNPNYYGTSHRPLMIAGENDNLEGMQLLLEAGANPNLENENIDPITKARITFSCVRDIISKDRLEPFKLFYHHQLNAKQKEESENLFNQWFFWATIANSKFIMEFLVDKIKDINVKINGKTFLYAATYNMHKDTVLFLLDKGARVSNKINGTNEIDVAYQLYPRDIADILVGHVKNSPAYSTDNKDLLLLLNTQTLYILATDEDSIEILLEQMAIYKKCGMIFPAYELLVNAVLHGNYAVCELLINHVNDINEKDGNNTTILYRLVDSFEKIKNAERLLALLLSKGANINTPNTEHDYTALHLACFDHVPEKVMRLLLEHHAKVEVVDTQHGITPLFLSCLHHSIPKATLLLSYQASMTAGKLTPIHLIIEEGYEKPAFLRLFMEFGFDPDQAFGSNQKTCIERLLARPETRIRNKLLRILGHDLYQQPDEPDVVIPERRPSVNDQQDSFSPMRFLKENGFAMEEIKALQRNDSEAEELPATAVSNKISPPTWFNGAISSQQNEIIPIDNAPNRFHYLPVDNLIMQLIPNEIIEAFKRVRPRFSPHHLKHLSNFHVNGTLIINNLSYNVEFTHELKIHLHTARLLACSFPSDDGLNVLYVSCYYLPNGLHSLADKKSLAQSDISLTLQLPTHTQADSPLYLSTQGFFSESSISVSTLRPERPEANTRLNLDL